MIKTLPELERGPSRVSCVNRRDITPNRYRNLGYIILGVRGSQQPRVLLIELRKFDVCVCFRRAAYIYVNKRSRDRG